MLFIIDQIIATLDNSSAVQSTSPSVLLLLLLLLTLTTTLPAVCTALFYKALTECQ